MRININEKGSEAFYWEVANAAVQGSRQDRLLW